MHPILSEKRILGLYLTVWLVAGGLLGWLLNSAGGLALGSALALSVPMALIYGFLCLASYYLCRAFPFHRFDVARLLIIHAVASALTSSLWISLGSSWAALIARISYFEGLDEQYGTQIPLLLALGISAFLLSVAINYALIISRESRETERQAMELRLLAQEAQLRALRDQINPHFLFNSLNSISALTVHDPQGARTMTLLLADFLRRSLSIGRRQYVTLQEEVDLMTRFLEIECVRYGPRLHIQKNVNPDTLMLLIPPLLLQPLVENAVNHGIAHMLDGGTISLTSEIAGGMLRLSIANPCETDQPRHAGHGIGLENVRGRLKTLFGPEAKLDIAASQKEYRVDLSFPALMNRPQSHEAQEMQV